MGISRFACASDAAVSAQDTVSGAADSEQLPKSANCVMARLAVNPATIAAEPSLCAMPSVTACDPADVGGV